MRRRALAPQKTGRLAVHTILSRRMNTGLLLRWRRMTHARWAIAVAAAIAPAACDPSTGALSADQEQRFTTEGVTRRADDIHFRFTRDPGGRSERWEDRKASIIVTKSSVLVHKNQKIGLEITPRTQKAVGVERSGDRIRLRSGTGKSEEVWSFQPPSDAPGWTTDIRAVIKASKGGTTK